MTGEPAEARAIDQRLRMFDAKADGERFRFEKNRAAFEHAQRVPRAVAERQHDVPSADRFTVLEHGAFDLALVDLEVRDFAFEPDFATELLDLRAHLLDDPRQAERADVRLAHEQDFFGRARAHELVHDLAAVELRILDLAV
jgi:hypothetical protein